MALKGEGTVAQQYDAVIVGGGHNGLVCGTYLAKAGLKVCVLERRSIIGGAVVSEELWPGYKISTASFVMSLMQPKIIADLELTKFGLETIKPPPLYQPLPDGRHLTFFDDLQKTCAEIAKFSKMDAEAYRVFRAHMQGLAPALRRLLWEIPPDIGSRRFKDVRNTLSFFWRFRDVGGSFYDLYDLLTLSAYDFLRRWFESDVLLAALGSYASGSGGNISLKSPGSAYVLMRGYLRGTDDWGFVRGGMGTITQAIARSGQRFGLEVRADAEVAKILVRNGEAEGVVLKSGEEIRGRSVVANASAKTTFLRLVEQKELPADFLTSIRGFRTAASGFKINLAVEAPPHYPAFRPEMIGAAYPMAVRIGPSVDYLERAFDASKYGGFAERPYLAVMVPSLADPTIAPPGKHVVSIFGGHAAYKLNGQAWTAEAREALYRAAIDTLSEYAPGFGNSVIEKQILTPEDLERIFDLPGGHVHQGELSVDQIFFRRPAPHYADYRSPIRRLYQCGASTHPGGGVTGVPGHNAARVILKELRR
jgi:phytoene dehydrogenase-like protein